jgi:glucose/arabinose dehydrogenase
MNHRSSTGLYPVALIGVLALTLTLGCAPGAPEGSPDDSNATDAGAEVFDTNDYSIRLVTVTEGLTHPYSFRFLPDGSMLVTEMGGQLRIIRDGVLVPEPVSGVPEVYSNPPSHGLMDLALHPDFSDNGVVYLSYNKMGAEGVTEAVARGTFNGSGLSDLTEIFEADAWAMTNGRQNARLAFAPDGTLHMSASVGGDIAAAQDMDSHKGKTVRLMDDGSVPNDNPFAGGAGARSAIFTTGHQNIHGMTLHPETGEIWAISHGDEINIFTAGGNYGWPYTNSGGGTSQEYLPMPEGLDLTPAFVGFDPQIRVSGIAFYTGDAFPSWQNNVFVGSMNNQHIRRVAYDDIGRIAEEDLFIVPGEQIRDLRMGPDGMLYYTAFVDEGPGRLRRIESAE